MPPLKGTKLPLGGKDRTLRYTMGSLDRLENETGLVPAQIQQRVNIGSIKYLIWLLWAGLIDEHPGLERAQVVQWLDSLTEEEEARVRTALGEAWSEATESDEEGEGDDPGKAAAAD